MYTLGSDNSALFKFKRKPKYFLSMDLEALGKQLDSEGKPRVTTRIKDKYGNRVMDPAFESLDIPGNFMQYNANDLMKYFKDRIKQERLTQDYWK